MEIKKEFIEKYKEWQKDPIAFISFIWKISPQPVKAEYHSHVSTLIAEKDYSSINAEHFEKFIKGKHITWQQWLVLLAVKDAVNKQGRNKISIASGHGIGKSTVIAQLILWYLFCFKDAQIPCTAPTAEQMHDILWKELHAWWKKMPEEIQGLYEWSNGYMRITESPNTWFARAKTARKENPEALAGVHGDFVMVIADEASGVPDEIFNTAEGAMTGPNVIVILISNPTRLIGYFYDTHHSDSNAWVNMRFSSNDSPIVDDGYTDRIIEKHGRDSDEYSIRVLGEFPKADAIDDAGYVPLILEEDIKQINGMEFVGDIVMGLDPAGEGRDETIWLARDRFKARIIATEKISNSKSIAQKTLTLMQFYNIRPENIYVDSFGIGANVSQEMAIEGFRINPINTGDKAYDQNRYTNLRAESFWKAKEWIRTGGEFIRDDRWKELLYIRYRNNLGGRLQIMPKGDMKKKLGKSPDVPDALSMTFIAPAKQFINREIRRSQKSRMSSTRRFKMA